MTVKRVVSALLPLCLLVSSAAAQSPSAKKSDEAGKEEAKKAVEKQALELLNNVLKEAAMLKLPENRIRAQMVAIDLLWKRDEKRARSLVADVMKDLNEIRMDQGEWKPEDYQRLAMVSQLRREFIETVARHDARLAREVIWATSPTDSPAIPHYALNESESGLELSLAARFAADDPAQALQIAEESLTKGLSHSLMDVLVMLQAKDKDAAAKLADGIVKKLRSENAGKDEAATQFAYELFMRAVRPDQADREKARTAPQSAAKNLALEEKVLKELANMIATAALNAPQVTEGMKSEEDQDRFYFLLMLHPLMAEIEKYAPAQARELRKKMAEAEKHLGQDIKKYMEYEMLEQTGDADALLEAAEKAPPEARERLRHGAINKATNEGDYERARQMINETMTDPAQRRLMLASIDGAALKAAAHAGKINETRQMLAQLTSGEDRLQTLIELAQAITAKGDKKTALQLLDEVRGGLGFQAENHRQLGLRIQLSRAYAALEPERSFEVVEPVIDQLNMLLGAAAMLDGFEQWRYFKDGEIMAQGPGMLLNLTQMYVREMASLARTDFERAKAAAEKFQRQDVRLLARLQVARGGLTDRLTDGDQGQSSMDEYGPFVRHIRY